MCIAVFAGINNSNPAAAAGRGLGRERISKESEKAATWWMWDWVGFASRKFGLKMFKLRLVTTPGLKKRI